MIYIFDVYGVVYENDKLNAGLLALMKQLRKTGSRVALASNMPSGQKPLFWEGLGLKGFADDFFCSGDLGVAKPAQAFYSRVATALKAEPESILFFDDSAANIDAAKACGWQAFLYTDIPSTTEILETFRK